MPRGIPNKRTARAKPKSKTTARAKRTGGKRTATKR